MEKYSSRSEVPNEYKWDLSDFYKNDEDFNKALEKAKKLIEETKKFVNCTKEPEKIYEFLTRDNIVNTLVINLYVYAMLKNDEELGISKNIERKNLTENLFSKYTSSIEFFKPELLKLSKEEYNKLFKYDKLKEFKVLLDEIYMSKDHVLSEREESIINELTTALNHYEDMSSTMLNSEHDYGEIVVNNENIKIRRTNLRRLLRNKDQKIRKEVYNKYRSVLDRYGATSAKFLDSYVKGQNAESRIRKFNSSWDENLFYNHMPNKAYEVLTKVVEDNINVFQKYIKMFKKVLNIKDLHSYDLSLELFPSNKKYTIEESIELIRKAISPLKEDYLKCFDKIIDNHYIDFCEYKGKCSGGYSASTADHDSRILLSFNEDLLSVSTIAHECGHNVHHQFIKKNNMIQYREVSSLVAEVISLTNECLLSSYLSNNGKTKNEKLAGIDNILSIIMSNLFDGVREAKMECDFYKYSLDGNAITKDYMYKLTTDSLKKYYGKDLILDEYSGTQWIGISHYYMNYYLYSYAFCMSAACVVSQKILDGDEEMLKKYYKFMNLGSDVYPIDAFKVLDIDLTDEKVYVNAINYFDEMINKFEKIYNE